MQRHQVENLIPLAFTVFSSYFIVAKFTYSAVFLLGIILTVSGLVVWWMGKLTLGDAFTALPKAKKLVITGIYSKISHPIYVGLSVMLIGWAVMMPRPWLIAIAGIIIASSAIRAHLENKALFKKFGKRYEDYRRKIWF